MKLRRILALLVCLSVLLCSYAIPVSAATESHKVMSYNVNGTGDYGDNTVGIIQKVINGDCDLVGFQEVPVAYRAIIVARMENLGYKGYGISDWDPAGQYAGAGWTNYVFYKTSKYNLIAYGTYSISETPENPHAFIKSLDTDDVNSEEYKAKWNTEGRPRNFNWFVLSSKATGDNLIFASAHVQRAVTSTTDYNAVALDLLGKQLNVMKAKYNCDVIVVGDFNSRDAAELLARGYTTSNPKNIATYKGGYVLDFITHTSGMTSSGFSADADKTVSDHYAIYATVTRTISATYTLTGSVAAGEGKVTFDLDGNTSAKAVPGQTVNAFVEPGPGYRVKSITVGGQNVSVLNDGLDATYNFAMPSANTTVSVSFEKSTNLQAYNLKAAVASGSGKVHFGNDITTAVVNEATLVNFQATPASGYKITKILVGDKEIEVQRDGIDWVYQFNMPRGDTTLSVYFSKKTGDGWVFDSKNKADWLVGCGVSPNVSVGYKDENGDRYVQLTTDQTAESNDPYVFIKPDYTFSADVNRYMTIVAKTTGSCPEGAMYLCAGDLQNPAAGSVARWTWINDGLWHEYVIDLSTVPSWKGNVNLLRFDFFEGVSPAASKVMFRSVKFSNSVSVPIAYTDKTSFAKGEPITVNYQGLGAYIGALDNPKIFIGIYEKGAKPGVKASMQYVYIDKAAGVVNFPADAAATSNYQTLPAGNYEIWLGYDGLGDGSALTVNNVILGNYSAASFTVTSTAYVEPEVPSDTEYDFVTGGASGNAAISATRGHKVSDAITNIAGLGGSTNVTVLKADGTAASATDLIATGMTASVNGKDYTIVVFGDVDCDGNVTVADSQYAYACLKGTAELSAASKDAAKMAKTGAVSIIDVMAVLNMI